MTTERTVGDDQRPEVKRGSLGLAARFYFLAALAHTLLLLISWIPAAHVAFIRLGWWLGPWPSFPMPYELEEFASRAFTAPTPELSTSLALLVAMMISMVLCVGILHSMSFVIAASIHSRLGWPQYWREVRKRLDLGSAWAVSARRSWWIWPLGQAVWLLLDQIAMGCHYAFYPIVADGPFFLVLHNVTICLAFVVTSSHVLSSFIVKAVDSDLLRCSQCGYLLRGIDSRPCPECGRRQKGVEYGIKRWRKARWSRTRRLLPWLTVLVLFLTPVWMPNGLSRLPISWLRFVPPIMRPNWQVLRTDSDEFFPIRLDGVCIIEHEGAIAIVWFEKTGSWRADYRVAYWSDVRDMNLKKAPETWSSGQVTNRGGRELPIGPWRFTYGAAGDYMFWLYRPNPSFSVTAFTNETLPHRFQGIKSVPGGDAASVQD